MDYDIIIYAVIAVLVLARLWSVLGQRNPEERERPNPFAAPPPVPSDTKDVVPGTQPQPDVPLLPKPLAYAPDSLAGGLARIKEADPDFDEKQFLQGARAAFTMILTDFAKGDLADITRLLGPHVLTGFRDAIEARRNAGHTMEAKIGTIRDTECAAARFDNGKASITVRFVSDQESIVRDSGGKVVSGGGMEQITDLWIFERDTRSADPNWILAETKS